MVRVKICPAVSLEGGQQTPATMSYAAHPLRIAAVYKLAGVAFNPGPWLENTLANTPACCTDQNSKYIILSRPEDVTPKAVTKRKLQFTEYVVPSG